MVTSQHFTSASVVRGTALTRIECIRHRVTVEKSDGLFCLRSPDIPGFFAVVDSDEKIRSVVDRMFRRLAESEGAKVRVLMNCDLSGPEFDVVLINGEDGRKD